MTITPQLLMELIESTIAARRETEDTIRDLRQQLEQLDDERSALEQEEQGYRLALTRRFPEAAAVSAPESAPHAEAGLFPLADDIADQSRSDAVETAVRVLTQAADFATPAGIEEFLQQHGRSDSRDAIGAALAYLNRSSRVANVGRAKWQLARKG
ncbi:hypothetical protein [Microbacterium kribbense]